MKKAQIRVFLGNSTTPELRRLPFSYKDNNTATILMVKNSMRQILKRPFVEIKVQLQHPNNKDIVSINDSEVFYESDNIWINAIDSYKPMMTDMATPTMTIATIPGNKEHIVCYEDVTLDSWSQKNYAAIEKLFTSTKPLHPTTGKINLYDYFNTDTLRPIATIMLYPRICPNQELYEKALEKLYECTVDILTSGYSNNDDITNSKTLTHALYDWFKKEIILEWSNGDETSALCKSMKSSTLRQNMRILNTVQRKSLTADELNLETIDAIANALRATPEMNIAESIYGSTISVRQQWYKTLLKNPNYENGLAETVIDKFPILQKDVNLLHYDYVDYMENTFGTLPDMAATINKFHKCILSCGTKKHNIKIKAETDDILTAAKILPDLYNIYSKKKTCTLDKFILATNNLNVEDLILRKTKITNQPVIGYTEYKNVKTYYILVDKYALNVPSREFKDALQCWFEVMFVFDLKYDENMAPMFEFLECLTGLRKEYTANQRKLKKDMDQQTEEWVAEQVSSGSGQPDQEHSDEKLLEELNGIIEHTRTAEPEVAQSQATQRKRKNSASTTTSTVPHVDELPPPPKMPRLRQPTATAASTPRTYEFRTRTVAQISTSQLSSNTTTRKKVYFVQTKATNNKSESDDKTSAKMNIVNTQEESNQEHKESSTQQLYRVNSTAQNFKAAVIEKKYGTQRYGISNIDATTESLIFYERFIDVVYQDRGKVSGTTYIPVLLSTNQASRDFKITGKKPMNLNKFVADVELLNKFLQNVESITLEGIFPSFAFGQIALQLSSCSYFNLQKLWLHDKDLTAYSLLSLVAPNANQITVNLSYLCGSSFDNDLKSLITVMKRKYWEHVTIYTSGIPNNAKMITEMLNNITCTTLVIVTNSNLTRSFSLMLQLMAFSFFRKIPASVSVDGKHFQHKLMAFFERKTNTSTFSIACINE